MLIDRPPFSQTVRYHRDRLRLTQLALSERLDIPLRTLKRWEAGPSQPDSLKQRLVLRALVEMSPEAGGKRPRKRRG